MRDFLILRTKKNHLRVRLRMEREGGLAGEVDEGEVHKPGQGAVSRGKHHQGPSDCTLCQNGS